MSANTSSKQSVKGVLASFKEILRRTDTAIAGFVIPLILSLTASSLEGLSVGLIGPLGKGVIEKDFSFLIEHPRFGWLFKGLWDLTDRPYAAFFAGLVAVIFIAAMLKNAFDYLAHISINQFSRTIQIRLKEKLFTRYLQFGKQYFDRNNTDYLRNVLNGFAPSVVGGITNLYGFISSMIMLAVYLTVMLVLSWQMALLSLAIYPLYHWSLNWLIQRIRKSSSEESQASTQLNVKLGSVLTGIPLVKAYAMEQQETKNYYELSVKLSNVQLSMNKKQALIVPIQEMITMSFTLILISAVSLLLVRDGSGNISSFLVYFVILRRSASKFGSVNQMRSNLAKLDGPMKHVLDVFSDKDKCIFPEGPRQMTALKSEIEFRDLSFSYLPEIPVLKNISFKIKKGSTAAIVGETGAGKSTIINLLTRYYDCPPASLLIDGVDIHEFTFASLRKHVALVSQECLLFDETIKNNILYGIERKVSDGEFEDILKKSRLHEYVQSLPKKWDTLIGERGVRLSGGEKQRLSIARAMVKGSDILILDEATSSLDSKTELLIQESIDDAIKDRTAIVIAHRLSTIKKADIIFVLEKGRVVEQGSLNELLSNRGKFYSFWQAQNSGGS